MIPGLVSISFRSLSPAEVVALVAKGKLRSIEWGGDIHVPHGNLNRAQEVRSLTEEQGLLVAAYGSYYRAGEGQEFEPVLEAALALGAPQIRVWTGKQASVTADKAYQAGVVEDLRRIAEAAQRHGVEISTEFHANTLTDTLDSLNNLFAAVDHPNLKSYWQPSVDRSDEICFEEIAGIADRLTHLHAYHWFPAVERRPLAEGKERWERFIAASELFPYSERHILLEFVRDDSPEAFLEDAATLLCLCQ